MRREDPSLQDTPDVLDVAATLYRRKWLILAIALPIIAAVAAYSYSRTPMYKATVGILVRPPLSDLTTPSRPSDISASTESNLATSKAVASMAKILLDSNQTTDHLLKHVSADMVQGTQVLTVSFTDPDPVQAQLGAKAFGDAYLRFRQEQAQNLVQQQTEPVTTQLDAVQQQIRTLSVQIQGLKPGSPDRADKQSRLNLLQQRSLALQAQLVTDQSIQTDPGQVIDPASVPTSPASPRHKFDLAFGILLGLGLGIGVALVKERSSDVVRTMVELEERVRAPVLASIPKIEWGRGGRATLVVASGRRTLAADGFRRFRTGLLGIIGPSEMKTVLITSASSGEGKTVAVANLGAGLAEIGKRVVLVSANLRRPALHRLFPTNDALGLTQVLNNEVSPSAVIQETDIPNLRIVHSGALSPELEPVNLLQTERMRELLAECGKDADFVLVDSAPVLGVPDTLVVAHFVDAIVFVADSRKTRWEDVIVARDQLERAGGTIVAGLLNKVEVSRHDRRGYIIDSQLLGLHRRLFVGRANVHPASVRATRPQSTAVPQATPPEGDGSLAAAQEGNGSRPAAREEEGSGPAAREEDGSRASAREEDGSGASAREEEGSQPATVPETPGASRQAQAERDPDRHVNRDKWAAGRPSGKRRRRRSGRVRVPPQRSADSERINPRGN